MFDMAQDVAREALQLVGVRLPPADIEALDALAQTAPLYGMPPNRSSVIRVAIGEYLARAAESSAA